MIEFAQIVYATLVTGIPLAYVAWTALRRRTFLPLVALVAALSATLLFPGQLLPATWLLLLVPMGVCLAIFTFYNCLSIALLFRRRPKPAPEVGDFLPAVTVVIPARDEARVIRGCLDSVLNSAYPADRLRIIVVDDGSTDETAQLVTSYRDRHPNVRLIVRPPWAVRGKAAALNDVIPEIDTEVFCILDADHQVAEQFFSVTLAHFQDPEVGSVQTRKVGRNWSESWLTRLMELESLGWQYSVLDSKSQSQLIAVSFGSGCLFRTELIHRLGGFDNDLATEDVEASLRTFEAGYKTKFEPGTYTTDELVSNWESFFRQRYRWARGTTQAIRRHWLAFYRIGQPTLREKVDFFFFPILLSMMVVPYLQVVTHALALVTATRVPLVYAAPLSYGFVIVACHFVAGLRNRREGGGQGPQRLRELLLLSFGMCIYYCTVLLVANAKAFLDEFVLGIPYRPIKTEHLGGERKQRLGRAVEGRPAAASLEEQLVFVCGRHSPEPEHVLALRPHLGRVDWHQVQEIATSHGVAGHVHANLVQYGFEAAIPPAIRADLLAFRRAVLARNLQLRKAWQELVDVFAQAEIEVIPLKGIQFINQFYPLDVRPIFDIDLLVKPTRVKEASRQLQALGYKPYPNPTVNGRAWFTERPFRHPDTSAVVDLHWDLVSIYTYRRIYALAIEELWQRARPSPSNAFLYEMAPEDVVLHSALHCAIHHHFVLLFQLVDLREVLRASGQEIDWTLLVELATTYRIKSPVYSSLRLSKRFVDAPVPDAVLEALRPPLQGRLFHRYLLDRGTILDRRTRARLERIKWGWISLILADSPLDTFRAIWASLGFGLAAKGWDESEQ